MGDLCRKRLIVELMGKHSNIIFCHPDGTIIDSIKHISLNVSSVREVLPGRMYFVPDTQHKADPLTIGSDDFISLIRSRPMPLYKAIYTSLTGFSPLLGLELCSRARLDSDTSANALSEDALQTLQNTFGAFMEDIKSSRFEPNIVYKDDIPVEFSCVRLCCL